MLKMKANGWLRLPIDAGGCTGAHMSMSEAIRTAARRLEPASDTARLDAELLMAHALGVSRSSLLINMGRPDWDVPSAFDSLIERRTLQEPVAYILGYQEFYGREFCVGPDVLIPRADSETLIDAALELAPDSKCILDLGTGSGVLLITMLLELRGASGIATDMSAAALAIAQKNAERLGLSETQARFTRADWRQSDWREGLGMFDLILCNPPYVETGAALGLNVRDFEPHSALFAGADGLDDYRILIPQFGALMKSGGTVILEIGAQQGASVSALAEAAGFVAELRSDLAGRSRAVILRL